MRLALDVDDPRLQLEAHDVAAVAEAVASEQFAHQHRLRIQAAAKVAEILGVEVALANLVSHQRP